MDRTGYISAVGPGSLPAGRAEERRTQLLWIILIRGIIALLGLTVAEPLGLLPAGFGTLPFALLFNLLASSLTLVYLGLWWSRWRVRVQLHLHIAVDLALTTLLVAYTRGAESPFVAFYLLIIIYASLTLGRNAGMVAAALSSILYAGLLMSSHFGLIPLIFNPSERRTLPFRVSLHALGFFAVALLGTNLFLRLRALQEELEQKIDSLRQLQTLHEHIIKSLRSGLVTTDLRGRIAVFNNAAEELTRRRAGEALEAPVQSILGDELWEKIVGTDLINDPRALRHESWISLPGEGRRYLGFSVSPLLDHTGASIGYVISFQDLTEIKRLEEEVRMRERMAAIGKMAAGIAHEIRNPLTSMRGSVEVLRSRLQLSNGDERLLDILIRESDRLNKFVGDFLAFARPGKYLRQPVDLVELLRDKSALMRNSSEVRGKHRIVTIEEQPHVVIQANPDQLQQVFWNLSQNALRAMPSGGTLTIRVGTIEGGDARVVFEDEGVGMTPEELEQLFQPFHSGFKGGTGLGLSISFQIVEDHRGSISFESEKGRGTTATLWLPAVPPPPPLLSAR